MVVISNASRYLSAPPEGAGDKAAASSETPSSSFVFPRCAPIVTVPKERSASQPINFILTSHGETTLAQIPVHCSWPHVPYQQQLHRPIFLYILRPQSHHRSGLFLLPSVNGVAARRWIARMAQCPSPPVDGQQRRAPMQLAVLGRILRPPC
ncbi:hypothetical protein PMIN06_013158 [Paraphaeosphaeria minitans]